MKENKKSIVQSERAELISLLQNFSNMRTGVDQVLWSIFGAFWGTNALLLISFFSANERWSISQVGIVVSIIGLIISSIWIIIQTRTIDRLQMYENSIQYIEKKLFFEKKLYAFSKVPKPSINFKIKARNVMKFNCFIIWFSWLIVLIYFIWTL
ncbi:MAG: hypothetical protein EHM93_16635 [Bacteroidales bacterium]|nr:MAG: hypothetical protein EHM93_16635 [Bacteroidales bacterium]